MKLKNSRTIIKKAKPIVLDLAFIGMSILVFGYLSNFTGYGALLLIPISVVAWCGYKDYKFRNAFILRFVIWSIVRSVFVFMTAIALGCIVFREFEGFAYTAAFAVLPGLIYLLTYRSLYKANHEKCRFDSCALSVAYDKATKKLRIASKTANYYGSMPSDCTFYFAEEIIDISTNTRATTSSGETITIHGTGSYSKHTRTFVYVSDHSGKSNLVYDSTFPYVSSQDKYIFTIKLADALKQILKQISGIYTAEMAPIYEAERKQAQELAKVAAEQRKADEEAAKEAASQKILENVRNQCSALLEKAGINEAECFKCYRYWEKDGGYICAMLAADKEGRGCAIFNEGKDTWLGSWKNAQINEVGDTLEVQIEDPEYRKLNLKERRFIIKYFSREDRLEWIDRIRILSGQA